MRSGLVAGPTHESALANLLLEHWAWGSVSTPFVQQIAAAARQDGLRHPSVDMLASLGNEGQCSSNTMRDLERRAPPCLLKQATTQIKIPLQINQNVCREVEQTVLLPHLLFAAIWANRRGAFSERISGHEGRAAAFWDAMVDTKQYAGHPIRARADRNRCVPVAS